jgi:hypothetical protein
VANIPLGLGCFIIGPFGGQWADAAALRWSSHPTGRMFPGLAAAAVLFPLATLAYAWTLEFRLMLAGPLVSAFFMGAAICACYPGVMSYISILKQHAAAAAGGAVQAVTFVCGGMVRGARRGPAARGRPQGGRGPGRGDERRAGSALRASARARSRQRSPTASLPRPVPPKRTHPPAAPPDPHRSSSR